MSKKNIIMRDALRENDVYLYELAERLNISEATMGRMMRKEQSKEKQKEYVEIIREIGEEKKNG